MWEYSNIQDRKIKVAIVGCGRISSKHFEAIFNHKSDMDLVAVCDINSKIVNEHAKKYSVPGYTNLKNMLDVGFLDMVILCTPSGLHAEQTKLAASYKVHVITEKPMATRWRDGLQMVKACDNSGVRLFVVKQNRFNSTLQLLKQAILDRRFGDIHIVHVNVFWSRAQSYYDQGCGWRGTWEFDGGATMNQASHYIDLLDWLVGPVEKVHAFMSTTREIEVEDTAVLNIKWRNGALGSVSVTMLAYPENIEGSITILGSKGSVRIAGVAVNKIELWQFEDVKEYDNLVYSSNYQTNSVYGFGHSAYYKNVIDVLRGIAEPQTSGRQGLKSLEILIAAYMSARDNKTISLPLEY